jgi:hypothetical protein
MNNVDRHGHFPEMDGSAHMDDRCDMAVVWTGPFAWPKHEASANLPPIPKHLGAYLITVEYRSGYLIYSAGITRRPVPERFREHTLKYMSGDYTVLDIEAMKQGVRKEIWHGWGWSPEKRADFKSREAAIVEAARRQLAGFRIFIANVGNRHRILERLEAAIMNRLYQESAPFCDIPDKGMMLAPRWESEEIIVVRNQCSVTLHGLPGHLEI